MFHRAFLFIFLSQKLQIFYDACFNYKLICICMDIGFWPNEHLILNDKIHKYSMVSLKLQKILNYI